MITEPWRWRFVLFWIILFTAAVAYALKETHDNASTNHKALCAFRTDLVQRNETIRSLMESGNVSPQDLLILKTLEKGQSHAYSSLASLDCG
jgi:hypothetical protein